MNTHSISAVARALVVLVSVGTVGTAVTQAAPYRFDVLHETTVAPGGRRLTSPPAVNDNGTAAFVLPAASGYYTLHVGTPGAVREVPTTGVPNRGGVAINNHDLVAFVGLPPGARSEFDYSAYVVSPGGTPRVVINRLGMYGDISRQLGISDAGQVIATIFELNAPLDEVLIGDGTGPATQVYRTLGHVGYPHMSSSGDYAFTFDDDPTFWRGFRTNRSIYNQAGYSFVYPGQSDYGFLTRVEDGDVASNGWAVFNGRWNNRPNELFRSQNGGFPQPVPGSQGLFGTAAINDSGTVAMLTAGPTTPNSIGLYVFHGEGPELVLEDGDPFLGSSVSSIEFDPRGFNNSEQIALLVGLADGRDVYVLASPVPEPGVVAGVIGVGAAAIAMRRRRPGGTP